MDAEEKRNSYSLLLKGREASDVVHIEMYFHCDLRVLCGDLAY